MRHHAQPMAVTLAFLSSYGSSSIYMIYQGSVNTLVKKTEDPGFMSL
jgi:hypothetical protein